MKSSMITKRLRISRLGNPPYVVPDPDPDPDPGLDPIIPDLPESPRTISNLNAPIGNRTHVLNGDVGGSRATCINRNRVSNKWDITLNANSPYWDESQFYIYYYITPEMISSSASVGLSFTTIRTSPTSNIVLQTTIPSAISGGGSVSHASTVSGTTTHSFTISCVGKTKGINKVSIFIDPLEDSVLLTSPLEESLVYDINSIFTNIPNEFSWVLISPEQMLEPQPGDRDVSLLSFQSDGRQSLNGGSGGGTDNLSPTTIRVPGYSDFEGLHDFVPNHVTGGGLDILNTLTDLTVQTTVWGPVNGDKNPLIGAAEVSKLHYILDPSYGLDFLRYKRRSTGNAEYLGAYTFIYTP